jgi:hypothetical protein
MPITVQLAYYTLTDQGISISWSCSSGGGAAGFEGAVVLRSSEGLVPTYPRDQVSGELSSTSFLDSNIQGGGSYTYRVVLLKGGAPVAYSATITANVSTSVDVTLSGSRDGNAAHLGWETSVSGPDPHATHYMVFRSTSGSDWAATTSVQLGPSARSYSDAAGMAVTWYYRVVLCAGDRVLATSNTVAIPASSP